jgi:hypothetical protein
LLSRSSGRESLHRLLLLLPKHLRRRLKHDLLLRRLLKHNLLLLLLRLLLKHDLLL